MRAAARSGNAYQRGFDARETYACAMPSESEPQSDERPEDQTSADLGVVVLRFGLDADLRFCQPKELFGQLAG